MDRHFKLYASDSAISPGHRGDLAMERYVVWQTDPASVPAWFDGHWEWRQGRSVIDQGDTVWSVSQALDSRGWVLEGPGYYSITKNADTAQGRPLADRLATFRIKAVNVPIGDTAATVYVKFYPGGSEPDVQIARYDIIGSTTGYVTRTLGWQEANGAEFMLFPVYWYGKGDLYIDEVTSKTDKGGRIIAGEFDDDVQLRTAPLTYGSGDSVVKAWYLNDEAAALENFAVIHRIDLALRDTTGHAPAAPVSPGPFYGFVKMAQPKYLITDIYPFASGTSYSSDYTGQDSISLQSRLSEYGTVPLREERRLCDTAGPGTQLIVNTQTFRWIDNLQEKFRYPTGYGGTCLAYLCLANGVDGLIYWKGLTWANPCSTMAGLLDIDGHRTPLFDSMAVLFAPFVDSLGDLFYDLKWINADSSEAVAGMTGSFISSLTSTTFPTKPYVEVAFFKDTVTSDDYFMLVNRRCLASESQQVRAKLSRSTGMYYIVDQYSRDTVLTGTMPDNTVPFTTSLGPGQGKLFKIIPAPPSVAGNSLPATWQGGISVGGNVTMEPGRTWNILPPARIRVDAGASYWIDVYGNMVAEGTATDSIKFLSAAASPAANDWYGIRARGTGNVSMKYAEVHHTYKGLWLWNTAATITATIEHCLFRRHYLAGISVEANAASSIAVKHSEFRDWGYYGVQIRFGKVDVDTNRFYLGGLNGIRVDGNYRDTVTGGHIRGNTFTTLSYSDATGIYIYGVRNDGLNWTTENFLEDNLFCRDAFGGSWSSPNQVAIQVMNCMDTLRFFRNAVWGVSGKPGLGVLINSTQVHMFGDLTRAERESAIDSVQYGLYCFNGLANDPDYAIVRASSFRAFAGSDSTAYDVWLSPLGKADLGHSGDLGNNVFRGQCNTPPPAYTVYNTNPGYMLPAQGNYWSAPGPLPLDEETIPPPTPCYYSSNNVDFTGYLASNPFAGGSPKLAIAAQTPSDPAKGEFGHLTSYPNPFNSSTVLKFSLAYPGQVEVAVLNILGQRVKTVCKDDRAAGEHQVIWDGQDEQSKPVASGVYFYTVTSSGKRLSKSIVLLK